MNKFVFSIICLILFANSVFADTNITYKTIGNKTNYYNNGKLVGTYIYKIMKENGMAETEACYGDYCSYSIMPPMMAKNYIYEFKSSIEAQENLKAHFEYLANEEEKLRKKREYNQSIIVKKVSVTADNGNQISIEEDGNGVDYLVINQKRVEKIGSRLATYKDNVKYCPNPEMYQLENIIAQAQQEDIYKQKKRTYNEIILSSTLLNPLFQTVYKLRLEQGLSYENAQVLMKFGIDNGYYKPSDLLLPNEKQAVKYKNNYKETSNKLKNVEFPKF